MNRLLIVLGVMSAASLAACTTVDPIATQEAGRRTEEAQAYAPVRQSQQQWLAKYAADKEQYLKQVGPSYPYAEAVKNGTIVIGMTEAAIDAAGYSCEVKEQSGLGTVDACTNMVQAFSTDGPGPEPYYVGFDSDGHVVSVQNP